MSKNKQKKEKAVLNEERIRAIAELLQKTGASELNDMSEEESTVEEIIDNMAIVCPDSMKEPYNL